MIGRNSYFAAPLLALIAIVGSTLWAQQSVTVAGAGGGTFGTSGFPATVNVTFNVSGLSGSSVNVTNVSVTIAIHHVWAGDVNLTLTDPQSNVHGIFTKIGGGTFGTANDFGVPGTGTHGIYTFNDAAAGNIWTAATTNPIPNGSYRTSDATGAVTTMNVVFAGLTAAQANGTWTLAFVDTFAGGDAGDALGTGCSLTVEAPSPSAPEIDIQDGSATSVPSGTTYTLATPMLGGSTGNTISFNILNTGSANLTISGSGTSGDSNCTSSVTTAPAGTVAPAGNTPFTVTFDLNAGYGSFSFVITINNDDANEGTYTITVQGTRGLAGTYAINSGGGGDFIDIGDAFNDVESFGLAGAAVFEITGNFTSTASYEFGHDGTTVNLIAGISATNTLTFRAATGQSPAITGSGATDPFGSGRSLLISVFRIPFVTFEGLTFNGGTNGGMFNWGDAAGDANSNVIRRCVFRGSGGFALSLGQNSTAGPRQNCTVENCFFFGNNGVDGWLHQAQLSMIALDNTNRIHFNTIYHTNTGAGAVEAWGGPACTAIINSNIFAADGAGTSCIRRSSGVEAYNYNLYSFTGTALFHNNTGTYADFAAWQTAGFDANGLTGNPRFVSTTLGSEDLHIEFTPVASAAINVADPTATLNVDFDGDSRPIGAGRDIGADETQLNAAPTLALATGTSFTAGSDFDLTVNPGATLATASLTASDSTPDPVDATITFNTGPMGATPPAGINAPANVTAGAGAGFDLTWTGTATASNDAGTYVWTVSLTDGVSTVNYSVRITIANMAPTHAAATGATGAGTSPSPYTSQHVVGNAGAANLATVADPNTSQTVSLSGTPTNTATPGTATITWSFAIAGGVLQATPSAAPAAVDVGDFDYTVVIEDNFTPAATTTFFVRISVIAGTAPAITSTAITTATVGTLYSYTFTMTGNPTPTLSLTTGTLPAWLTLTGNTLSGTPPTGSAATYGPFTFTASNGVLPNATQTFSIVVSNASSGGGGGGKKGGGGGCSTGENSSLWVLAGVMASFALALRLRRKSA